MPFGTTIRAAALAAAALPALSGGATAEAWSLADPGAAWSLPAEPSDPFVSPPRLAVEPPAPSEVTIRSWRAEVAPPRALQDDAAAPGLGPLPKRLAAEGAVIRTPGRTTLIGRPGALPGDWPGWLPAPRVTISGDPKALPRIDPDAPLDDTLRRLAAEAPPSGTIRIDLGGRFGEVRHDAETGRARVRVPVIGLDRRFKVRDNAHAARIARRLLRRHAGDLTTAALRFSAAETPDDPLAGNPRSLLTRLALSAGALEVAPRFAYARGGAGGYPVAFTTAEGGVPTAFADAGGPAPTVVVPVAEGVGVTVTAPLRHAETGGATHASGGLGVGLAVKPLSAWTVGGMLHWGAAAETDRSAGALYGVSGVSRLTFGEEGPVTATVISQLSSFATMPVQAAGRRLDYDLSALVARNGVAAQHRLKPKRDGATDVWSVEMAETRFLGADLYVERSYEAALGWRRASGDGRHETGARLSAALDDRGATAVRLGLDLAF